MTVDKMASYVPDDENPITKNFAKSLLMARDKMHQLARAKVYYDNPHIWANEVLGFFAWSKQRDIGRSVVENAFTAVKSCHGAGKSAWAAVIVCWFVATRLAMGENVFVITTAPSYQQVHLVLWEEIRRHHSKGGLPGRITGSDVWKIDIGDRTVDLAVGRKPADTDENSFQGKHEDNLLIVLDEANGIPATLYTGATVMLTGNMDKQRMLAIGNPDDPNSQFGINDARDRKYILQGEEPIWNTIQIKAWDTPNFTDEWQEIPEKVRSSVLQPGWVKARSREWDKDDMRWISKIEAEFPLVSEDSLFSLNLIEQSKENSPDPGWDLTDVKLGVDVARYGQDKTVVVLVKGGVAQVIDHWGKKSTVETTNRVHKLAMDHQATEIRVDEGGVGGGVLDQLTVMQGYNYRVIAMNSGSSSPNKLRWVLAKDYWYDNLREQMLLNKVQLMPHKDLEFELSQVKFSYQNNALRIEKKSEMKKRLKGRSPDFADALVMATADLSGIVSERGSESLPAPGTMAVLETVMRNQAYGWSVSPV